MYDLRLRKECKNLSKAEMLEYLDKFPDRTVVIFNGDECGYIIIDQENKVISMDDQIDSPSLYIGCNRITVGMLRNILQSFDDSYCVYFNGDKYGYIHAEEDMSYISMDDAALEDEYENVQYTTRGNDVVELTIDDMARISRMYRRVQLKEFIQDNYIKMVDPEVGLEKTIEEIMRQEEKGLDEEAAIARVFNLDV